MDLNNFIHDGEQHQRLFCLTGVADDTRSYTWHSVNQLLIDQPIETILALLNTHYNNASLALKLFKQGNISKLATKFSECEFTGEPIAYSLKPTPHSVIKYDVTKRSERIFHEQKVNFVTFHPNEGWRCYLTYEREWVKTLKPITTPTHAVIANAQLNNQRTQMSLF